MKQLDRNLRPLTGYQLRRATSATMPAVNKILSKFGLRRSTYSSLVVVVANPGLNQGQLADSLAIERPNVVQIIDQLERAKLVVREKSAEDRRAYALKPTPKGAELEARATKALQRHDARLTLGLSAEEKAVMRRCLEIVERNAENLEARDVCA